MTVLSRGVEGFRRALPRAGAPLQCEKGPWKAIPPRGAHGGPQPRAQPRQVGPRAQGFGESVTGGHRQGTVVQAPGAGQAASSEKDPLSPDPFGKCSVCSPRVGVTGKPHGLPRGNGTGPPCAFPTLRLVRPHAARSHDGRRYILISFSNMITF